MKLQPHQKLAQLLNTANASLKQMHKTCAKHSGPESEITSQIKELLNSLSCIKQHLLADLDQSNNPHINPYGK
jgi:hypothetical protein